VTDGSLKVIQEAVCHCRFRPSAATWRIGRNILVVIDSDLFPALYENTTSSTKPEVHNIAYHVAIRGQSSHGHV